MKKAVTSLLFTFCLPTVFAGYTDGYITAGEYEGFVTWRSYEPPLIVDGGGAVRIAVENNGQLVVRSTSTPLQLLVGGVYDIDLSNGHLLYLNGRTDTIRIAGENASAILKGGHINYLKSLQYTTMTGADPHIDLYCQLDSWSWINNNPLIGIQGLWLDGTSFYIQFINHPDVDPVWTNLNIIPEPTTTLLLAFGGLLMHRKRMRG